MCARPLGARRRVPNDVLSHGRAPFLHPPPHFPRCPTHPVSRTGVFNFHTLGGNVVVNNLAATHYGKPAWTAAPSLATAWYHAVDAMSRVVGAEDASKTVRTEDHGATVRIARTLSERLMSGKAAHGSLRA